MKTKSFKYRSLIYILASITLFLLILCLVAYGKYTDKKEEFDKVSLYLYELEVETPLEAILNYIGTGPIELVDWDKQGLHEELTFLFNNLDKGLFNVDYLGTEVIPEETLTQLWNLQKIIQIIVNDTSEDSINNETKERIIKLTNAINSCEMIGINRSWNQVHSELECLLNNY
ncbi:hypothetical protein [Ornithinibacillus bavariensis]|uniref:Uncharacterized protein n=1 Tax=Ornithinibacillus bavariensis TaxID=545502 RepID=A0A920C7T0_9BACI|nr:hypothetical protein [Ornithinibacillus bavariensis]GIO27988.1 hypothetical protein J43TS3_25990 [Ornithinibacillus bavariensis]